MQMDRAHVALGKKVTDKAGAIEAVGELLVDTGHIQPGYIESMMGRERVANTYLGNGIAIPHGLPKNRDLIKETGIAVVQIPEGVEWNPGERVVLVIGIAARSDEHVEVLGRLTDILDREELIERLAVTTDVDDIVKVLAGGSGEQVKDIGTMDGGLTDFDLYDDVCVMEKTGLHARPASALVELAKAFESEIHVRHTEGGRVVNGKSMAALLKLRVREGESIRIMAQGIDAGEAVKTLVDAIRAGLVEEDEEDIPVPSETGWAPTSVGVIIPGVAASRGMAIGPIRLLKKKKIVVEAKAHDIQTEQRRLKSAIATAKAELEQLIREITERAGAGKAAIFKAHIEFLEDPELFDFVNQRILEGFSAAWAWREIIAMRVAELEQVDDEVLAARAVDLNDAGSRVLRILAGEVEESIATLDQPVILLADDLTPSDTVGLDPAWILGICTAGGGALSHSAIIARSLGIPAVVGAGPVVLHQVDGMTAVLDGNSGNLYLEPCVSDLESAREIQHSLADVRAREKEHRYKPAITTDGERVEVAANISRDAEAEEAVNAGGEGVGLLRTEFLFLERSNPPSEEEQYASYATMVKALNGLPLTARTLDIGGDKKVSYLNLPPEENPFLGVRGIRLCQERPDLLKDQLRALVRASKEGPVRIMFPMISMLSDLRAAKELLEEIRQELDGPKIEVGIMIEVPSAVMMAAELAAEVDFFSIGTNDLTQYTLAMDRGHPLLASRADGLHPAVLRMIDIAVRAAAANNCWVGVCGGMAGDPQGAAILSGLGVKELSVSIPSIATVKERLRRMSMKEGRELARKALQCTSAEEVRALTLPK